MEHTGRVPPTNRRPAWHGS